MEYTMGLDLENISLNMSVIKKLCKINEYKGQQIIYKKQSKHIMEKLTENAICNFVYDTYSNDFLDRKKDLKKIIDNEVKPNTRNDVAVVEFRDVIKTVNSAYENIEISSKTILELHGYLHRYSLIPGGKYRNEDLDLYNLEYKLMNLNNIIGDKENIEQNIEKKITNICRKYYNLLNQDKVQDLIVIGSFIIDFMLILPFKEDNVKMAKVITLLLLNKSGYEIGRFTSLGNCYETDKQIFYINLINKSENYEIKVHNFNKWLDYFLSIVLEAYEGLDDKMHLAKGKKETKTRRIEKIISSTLGYFTKDDIRQQCPDIPEPTINRVFNNLRKDGKIEVVAKGRSAKWKKR